MVAMMQVELRSRALLAMGVGEVVVPIFDEEPTSIIAYALTSRSAANAANIAFACSFLLLQQGQGRELFLLFLPLKMLTSGG